MTKQTPYQEISTRRDMAKDDAKYILKEIKERIQKLDLETANKLAIDSICNDLNELACQLDRHHAYVMAAYITAV